MRPYSAKDHLPGRLHSAEQVRAIDAAAIQAEQVHGFDLMERAGEAAFSCLLGRWSQAEHLCILAGPGNNGGDGYVLAALASYHGLKVTFYAVGDHSRLSDSSTLARDMADAADIEIRTFDGSLNFDGDLIIDALLGTGLDRPVGGDFGTAIQVINEHAAEVMALDVPSGLNATTGQVLGNAVVADMTVTFVAVKQGLLTCDGPDVAGEIAYASLDIQDAVLMQPVPTAERISWDRLERLGQDLPPRLGNSHKGQYGHMMVVGGDDGMAGAVTMCAEAGCRMGAGLVTCVTQPGHTLAVHVRLPELMVKGVTSGLELEPLLERASVAAAGPGLGQSSWSGLLFQQLMYASCPMVLDADGLNWLARPEWQCDFSRRAVVLTPHPAEAARLLGCSTAEIQADRFQAAARLAQQYQAVVVLKGQGTLVARPASDSREADIAVCTDGNPGMSTGGMGDVLTGVIAALMAQGQTPWQAARLGVCLHSAAADLAVREYGPRGLLATDLMNYLRKLNNR